MMMMNVSEGLSKHCEPVSSRTEVTKRKKEKKKAKKSHYLEVKYQIKGMHSRTSSRQFYNQVLVLNSKQTPELLEKREGISSAQCCLIRLWRFKRRG